MDPDLSQGGSCHQFPQFTHFSIVQRAPGGSFDPVEPPPPPGSTTGLEDHLRGGGGGGVASHFEIPSYAPVTTRNVSVLLEKVNAPNLSTTLLCSITTLHVHVLCGACRSLPPAPRVCGQAIFRARARARAYSIPCSHT